MDSSFPAGSFRFSVSVRSPGGSFLKMMTGFPERTLGAILSYSYWKRRFGQDVSAVGKTLILDRAPYTVIGVTPPEFFGVSVGRSPDLYLPMMMQTSFLSNPHANWLQVMGRLKPGVIQGKAEAELATLFSQQLAEISMSDWTARDQKEFLSQRIELVPAGNGLSDLRRHFSKPLWILMSMVALVLLTSCANVATLLLARAAARQKEIAVRLAVGEGRARLIRQLLTESILLAGLAGGSGLLLAYWTADLLAASCPDERRRFCSTCIPTLESCFSLLAFPSWLRFYSDWLLLCRQLL
jgi:ABC-type antimicrobial peptide transport system permease subunit